MNMIITFELNEQEKKDLAFNVFTEELANRLPAAIGEILNVTAKHMVGVIKRNFSELARAKFQAEVLLSFQRVMDEKQIFNVSKKVWEEVKGSEDNNAENGKQS